MMKGREEKATNDIRIDADYTESVSKSKLKASSIASKFGGRFKLSCGSLAPRVAFMKPSETYSKSNGQRLGISSLD
jgi:hypothetical protein